jgi:aspartyl-tRNA(Asn)/glutamyl-tRNA(Gln) amidotransferase subunit A
LVAKQDEMSAARTACAIAQAVAAGKTRAARVCDLTLRRIEARAPGLRAFTELTFDHARRQAARVDGVVASGQPAGLLAGVPIAIKDNICTSFGRTTCGSKMLAGYRSPYDATAIRRLEDAGAVIVGKTNLDEFGMGSSTENSAFEPTRNPWNVECVPGGSSGGSAVAVAAGLTPIALGSDTGGSVRQPASFCGVVGLKPSYGRVSRYGLVAYGSSLDQIGPLARSVSDAALVLGIISGRDPHDSTSVDQPVDDYVAELNSGRLDERLAGLRIGVPKEYFGAGLDTEVRAAVERAIDVYRRLGAGIIEVSLPHTPYCIATYYLIATAECSSNLARFDGVHYGYRAVGAREIVELYSASRAEGFGTEVKRRIMLGTFALSAGYYDAYYNKALQARKLIRQDFEVAFAQADVLACPTAPTPAFRLGERLDDPLQMYLADVYTTAANLAGIPAISIPCGFSAEGLPIGLQLLAPLFGEALLLQAARIYERETDWHTRRPPR